MIQIQTYQPITNFFGQSSTPKIAKALLGKRIIMKQKSGSLAAWITEDEAYVGKCDRAAHSYRGKKTHRNRAMFMDPGTIYVFSIFGHDLLNFITKPAGNPQGVLIRAVEPETGISTMQRNRNCQDRFNLTNGPGKLTQALGIPLALNTRVLNQSPLKIDLTSKKCRQPDRVKATRRIGVPRKGIWTQKKLRYYVLGNPFVSKTTKRQVNRYTYGWQNKARP